MNILKYDVEREVFIYIVQENFVIFVSNTILSTKQNNSFPQQFYFSNIKYVEFCNHLYLAFFPEPFRPYQNSSVKGIFGSLSLQYTFSFCHLFNWIVFTERQRSLTIQIAMGLGVSWLSRKLKLS